MTWPTPGILITNRNLRVQHWANALNQGVAAGAERGGATRRPDNGLPYFFSDQYDLGLEYVGYSHRDDAVEIAAT